MLVTGPRLKGQRIFKTELRLTHSSFLSLYIFSFSRSAAYEESAEHNPLITFSKFSVSTATDRGFFVRWLLIPFLRPILLNMREMEIYLDTSCQDIDYTIVRPPGLHDGASTCEFHYKEKLLILIDS